MNNESERLHIEEVKRVFSKKNIITIADFNDFYKSVFTDISRKTVSWYIYGLKKRNIIKHISRGQYALVGVTSDEPMDYTVITLDVIKSSRKDTFKFQYELEDKVKEANRIIKKYYSYNRKFNIFQGDEIQILCPFDDRVSYLLMIILCCIRPFEVRYGISIGKVSNELDDNSWDMNGPIFWNARDQLNKIKKDKEYSGLIKSDNTNADKYCNGMLPLINKAIVKITDKQWEAIKFELCKINVDQAINKLVIGRASYYDRISLSNYHEIMQSINSIVDIMKVRTCIK